jgi:hypothetical protein
MLNGDKAGMVTAAILASTKDILRAGKHSLVDLSAMAPSIQKSLDVQNAESSGYKKYIPAAIGGGVGLLGALALARMAGGVNRAADSREGGRVQMRLPSRNKQDAEATVDIPIGEAGLSPTLLRGLGVDTRRKIRREVKAQVRPRGYSEDDDYDIVKEASIVVGLIKKAALNSTSTGVGIGFMPIEQPKPTTGATSLDTTQSQGKSEEAQQPTGDPIQAHKHMQAQQAAEIQRMNLENQKLQADIQSTNAQAAPQPTAAATPAPQVDNKAFTNSVIGVRLKDLGQRAEKLAAVFDQFKKWDDNSGALSANTALSFTPGVGSVMSGMRAVNAFSDGNYGQAALHTLGAIPLAGGFLSKGLGAVGKKFFSNAPKIMKPVGNSFLSHVASPSTYRFQAMNGRIDKAMIPAPVEAPQPAQAPAPANPFEENASYRSLLPTFGAKTAADDTPEPVGKLDLQSPDFTRMKSLYGAQGAAHVLNRYGAAAGVKVDNPYANGPMSIMHKAMSPIGRKIQSGIGMVMNLPPVRDRAMSLLPSYSQPSEVLGEKPGFEMGAAEYGDSRLNQLLQLVNEARGNGQ